MDEALKPPQPPDNRLNANWKLLLQIAQHAGGGWPEQARQYTIYLSRAPYEQASEYSCWRFCGRCSTRTARK